MSEWENVAHEGNRAGWITDGQAHSNGLDQREGQEAAPGISIEYSISPGVPCPQTVLVAVMTDGSYLVMSYPQGEPGPSW
jgi:hypothetical protein